jgi:hypothetical protein
MARGVELHRDIVTDQLIRAPARSSQLANYPLSVERRLI